MNRRSTSAAAALLFVARLAAGQQTTVTWSLTVPEPQPAVKAGDRLTVAMTARIAPGWHLYAVDQAPPPIATRIRIAKGQPFTLDGPVVAPEAASAFDPNFEIEVRSYAGEASFTLPVRVERSAPPGRQTLVAEAYYQACDDRMCLPPQLVKAQATVEILAAAPSAAAPLSERQAGVQRPAASTVPGPSEAAAVESPAPMSSAGTGEPSRPAPTPAVAAPAASPIAAPAASPIAPLEAPNAPPRDLAAFIWLAMVMGAVSLLTPCVFPMVPITVSYFTRHSSGHRREAVGQALVYAGGIILTFTALGMLMAVVFGAASLNRFAANPWVNLLITAIFLAFAANLLGMFVVSIPSGLLTSLDRATRRTGGSRVVATLLMGLTFTLTSFTCTAPFIGTLLVMAAGGQWVWPLAGMLAYATVFALPFFVLALVPQWASRLPRAGASLNAVKVVMGLLEIAAAMKFLSNVDLVWGWGIFTRDVVLASWVGLAILIALYVLGTYRFGEDAPVDRVGPGRFLTALASLTLAFWLVTGLAGRLLGELEAFLPPILDRPAAVSGAGTRGGELPWIVNDLDAALAEGRRTGRRVFVDFTGYTCTNCRWMETNMFPRDEVRRRLDRFVRVRLYTDGAGETYRRQQQLQQRLFGTVALPLYVVMDEAGLPLAVFPGLTRASEEFTAFLDKGLGE